MLKLLVLVVFFCVVAGVLRSAFNGDGPSRPTPQEALSPKAAPAAKPLPAGYDPEKFYERETLLEELQAKNIFGGLDIHGNNGGVVVRPVFYTLDFEMKKKFVGVAYAWCLDKNRNCDFLLLTDSKTGKTAGTFSMQLGLRLN